MLVFAIRGGTTRPHSAGSPACDAIGQYLYAEGRSSWPVSQASCAKNSETSSSVQRCITKLMCCAGQIGLHNVILLASEDRADWPPVSPLSMTRCLPDLWVMTHRGISRCALLPMSLKNSVLRKGDVQNPLAATAEEGIRRPSLIAADSRCADCVLATRPTQHPTC